MDMEVGSGNIDEPLRISRINGNMVLDYTLNGLAYEDILQINMLIDIAKSKFVGVYENMSEEFTRSLQSVNNAIDDLEFGKDEVNE